VIRKVTGYMNIATEAERPRNGITFVPSRFIPISMVTKTPRRMFILNSSFMFNFIVSTGRIMGELIDLRTLKT